MIDGLKAVCTDVIYNSLLTTYCSHEELKNRTVTYEVATYSSSGGSQSSTCAASGCASHTCSSLQTNYTSGACVVRDSYTSMPTADKPDLGTGYAKKHITNVNTIEGLKNACTNATYSSILTSYCTINSNPVTYEVVTYGSGGGFQ